MILGILIDNVKILASELAKKKNIFSLRGLSEAKKKKKKKKKKKCETKMATSRRVAYLDNFYVLIDNDKI